MTHYISQYQFFLNAIADNLLEMETLQVNSPAWNLMICFCLFITIVYQIFFKKYNIMLCIKSPVGIQTEYSFYLSKICVYFLNLRYKREKKKNKKKIAIKIKGHLIFFFKQLLSDKSILERTVKFDEYIILYYGYQLAYTIEFFLYTKYYSLFIKCIGFSSRSIQKMYYFE
ncbi:hypothetical protein AGLY_014699 [Aphis glycines]|uniref:Transmembrane protein n=1 Tax=Aphis glycines TaxID=307491 RepID=A0A6G0T242_APHGL|nr:hypothetical protein AGLY_014699 [Aphis glycines]